MVLRPNVAAVNRDDAERLASDWVARHEVRSESVLGAQSWMAKEIETLSDDALAAAAVADGTPVIVALDGERACWLTLDGNRESKVRTHPVRKLPDSGRISVASPL
jgi:hypothetical protein